MTETTDTDDTENGEQLQAVKTKAPIRSRTRSQRGGLYLEVTAAQGEVIRAKAARDGITIKDVLLNGVMRLDELEATCGAMRQALRDIQAMLISTSTVRALTGEEAQIWSQVTGVLTLS